MPGDPWCPVHKQLPCDCQSRAGLPFVDKVFPIERAVSDERVARLELRVRRLEEELARLLRAREEKRDE